MVCSLASLCLLSASSCKPSLAFRVKEGVAALPQGPFFWEVCKLFLAGYNPVPHEVFCFVLLIFPSWILPRYMNQKDSPVIPKPDTHMLFWELLGTLTLALQLLTRLMFSIFPLLIDCRCQINGHKSFISLNFDSSTALQTQSSELCSGSLFFCCPLYLLLEIRTCWFSLLDIRKMFLPYQFVHKKDLFDVWGIICFDGDEQTFLPY